MNTNIKLSINQSGELEEIKILPNFDPASFMQQKFSQNDLFLQLIQDTLAGKPIRHIELTHSSPFAKKILLSLLQVPRGKVISYSGLANLAKQPQATRAVATVMANNPLPIIYPCHRVVPKDGHCGIYSGIKNNPLKKRLLIFEGVQFTEKGLITKECFYAK